MEYPGVIGDLSEVGSGMSRSEKTFGEVVAKQSMENIWSLFENDKQKLQSTELEYQYHSCSDVLVKQLEIKISGLLQRELKLQQNTSG